MPRAKVGLEQLRTSHVKRKVFGDNSPANLFWNVWSESERDIFLDVCGPAMQYFGYTPPPSSDAPRQAVAKPTTPAVKPPLIQGALTTLWAFTKNPRITPVLVCGERKCAKAAAMLLGSERSVLLLEDGWTDDDTPAGFRVATIDQAVALGPRGIFIAERTAARERMVTLRAHFPDAEIILARSEELTAAHIAAIEDRHRVVSDKGIVEVSRDEQVTSYGPLRTGVSIVGWQLDSIRSTESTLRLGLCSPGGQTVVLELVSTRGEHRIPFPIRGGGLTYRPSPVPWREIERLCRVLAHALRLALGKRALPEAMAHWHRAAALTRPG